MNRNRDLVDIFGDIEDTWSRRRGIDYELDEYDEVDDDDSLFGDLPDE